MSGQRHRVYKTGIAASLIWLSVVNSCPSEELPRRLRPWELTRIFARQEYMVKPT